MKQDRRVRYTKKALQEALLALMQEKPLEKISVKELCEKADINRSTFYVYFGSPKELLNSILEEMYGELAAKPRDFTSVREFLTGICRSLWQYRDLMNVISRSHELIDLLFRLMDIWRENFMQVMHEQGLEGERAELAYRFVSTGTCFTIGTWVISGGMGQSAADMAEELEGLLLYGLSNQFTKS